MVLICMTEKYKESPNCRLEGEYCNQQKKPFIPLLMQDKYRPNGWQVTYHPHLPFPPFSFHFIPTLPHCVITFPPLLLPPSTYSNYRLGLLLGSRLYHNFSTESDWDNKFAILIKEIGDMGKISQAVRTPAAVAPVAPVALVASIAPPPKLISSSFLYFCKFSLSSA